MSKREKTLARMRLKAKGWRYDQIAGILKHYGFTVDNSNKGSHRTHKHASGARVTLVDSGSGTLLPVYIEKALEQLDLAREAEDDS